MNALTGIENLVKQPGILNCGYWGAYTDKIEDQHRLRDNYTSEGTIEEAEKSLRILCNDLAQSGANLVIWFSIDKKPNKGGYRIPFYIPSANGFSQAVVGNINSDVDIQKRIKEGIDLYLKEKELNDLRAKVKELEREIDSTPLARVLNRIAAVSEPYIPQLLNEALPMDTNNTIGIINKDEQKIAEDALTRLNKITTDLPLLLKKLADLAENKPMIFKVAIDQLNKL